MRSITTTREDVIKSIEEQLIKVNSLIMEDEGVLAELRRMGLELMKHLLNIKRVK